MGRKGNWFSSVKKALSPESKESKKSKKKWFRKAKAFVPDSSPSETVVVPHPLPPPEEEVELDEVQNEQTKHAYFAPVASADSEVENEQAEHSHSATAFADEAAIAATEVVQVTAVTRTAGKSKEEMAAIKIQTAFRGHMSIRALRALRGLVRLKSLVQGTPVKRQTATALKCMQTLARVQSQIHSRRVRMAEENQALQRQLLQKSAKELASLQSGEEWDDSQHTKQRIEANLLSKYEAAMRRERALAYSYSHQQTWKKSARPTTLMFMDPNNPHWGWSWLERWMAAQPGEDTTDKELKNDQSSIKSGSLSLAGGEVTKAYARHQLNSEKPLPTSSQKPSLPSGHRSPSTTPSKAASSAVARKLKPASPKGSVFSPDDDANSMSSVLSERNRRHSIAGSSVRDDESLASSPAVPSYMAPTHSAKAKTRLQSPLGLENGMPEKESFGSAKKRLSFPASPARPRRHSGPPKVDLISVAESTM